MNTELNTEAHSEAAAPTRPLGVAHLIFGLIFTGIATIWMIGEASGSRIEDYAPGFPVVLIGAGLIGLMASVFKQRQASARAPAGNDNAAPTGGADLEDTTVLTTDQKDES